MPAPIFVHSLSQEEEEELQELYQRTHDADLRTRCHMILLSNQGWTAPKVGKWLMFSDDAVLYWIGRYEKEGIEGLQTRPCPGRPPKADSNYDKELNKAARQDPRELGYNRTCWTRGLLALHLEKKTGTDVTEWTVGYHLHQLGWRLLRPVRSVASPDPEYEAKRERVESLKEGPGEDTVLVFADEIDLELLPGVTRMWTPKGEQRRLPTKGRSNPKRYGFGAVGWEAGDVVFDVKDSKNNINFRKSIKQVVEHFCEHFKKVVMVVDNASYHHAKKVKELAEKLGDRFQLVFLPTYSPDLNPIELLWKHLRRRVTHNHTFQTIKELIIAVRSFIEEMVRNPEEVLSVIGSPV